MQSAAVAWGGDDMSKCGQFAIVNGWVKGPSIHFLGIHGNVFAAYCSLKEPGFVFPKLLQSRQTCHSGWSRVSSTKTLSGCSIAPHLSIHLQWKLLVSIVPSRRKNQTIINTLVDKTTCTQQLSFCYGDRVLAAKAVAEAESSVPEHASVATG